MKIERVNKEKNKFFERTIKYFTRQIDSLLPTLNSTILEYKELYREACKPRHLTKDINEEIRKTQNEIYDIVDNTIGSLELASVLDQEMAIYEEKIEKLEREKARLRMKTWEFKNKLGPRLDNLLTHQNELSKVTIQGERSPEK